MATVVAVAATTTAVLAQEPARESEARRRQAQSQILMMEVALAQAVRSGANDVAAQLLGGGPQVAQMTDLMFLSAPEARGFELPGYGVVFHVRVPGMRSTFVFAAPYLVQTARQRQRQVRVPTTVAAQSLPAASADVRPPVVGTESAASMLEVDPDEVYTRQVRLAILNVMLENSYPLRLGPDERLTVAARDDTPADPLVPGDATSVQTMLFTVTGRDLAAYHERRISLDEAMTRVTIDE